MARGAFKSEGQQQRKKKKGREREVEANRVAEASDPTQNTGEDPRAQTDGR